MFLMNSTLFHGLLVVDKPGGITSREAVDRAARWFPRRTRIGHTGTLDPLATGVLVLGVGMATRLAEFVQRMAKTYCATLLLGARSDTDDADGAITAVPTIVPPSRADVDACLTRFLGELDQVPPHYSAAHVTGRRAYDLARKGEQLALAPRRVRIDRIELQAYAYPRLEIEVQCGKGTYIRALARDVGGALGCGALVERLRRTRVGPFRAEGAVHLDSDAQTARSHLLPLGAAVSELSRLVLSEDQIGRLRHGQAVHCPAVLLTKDGSNADQEAAIFDQAGNVAAVVRIDHRMQVLIPDKVFAAG
jgi:tRNA pseudouridine55 synthase